MKTKKPNNNPILFIDSGIGGLFYCVEFSKRNPNEAVCCLADRLNFPYGPRGKDELCAILIPLIEKLLKSINPKIIVIACNTAAISALNILRSHYPGISFVGTVPAIKPAVIASKNKKIGILGTARTIEDPYNQKLADEAVSNEDVNNENAGKCEIIAAAAPELVEFVEYRLDKADENEKIQIVRKYIDIFRAQKADALVLGCTHFLYLLDVFKKEAAPDIKVFDSLSGIIKRIEFLLDDNSGAQRADSGFKPEHKFIITGDEPVQSVWKNRAEEARFKLSLLNEI